MPGFRRPGRDHRATIIGRTGTGKSVFAMWLLSYADLDRRPWLIIDYKGEPMFDRIGKRAIRELSPGAGVPRRPGLYYMNPIPKIDDKAMIETFWKIWEHGRTGLYFDEVLNVPDDPSFESLCVQGRSKHIQMIMCNQRPYDLSTYVLTQSDFVAAFPVQRVEDQRCLESYLGRPGIMRERRPKRHALWLDVEEAELMELTPRPPPDHILGRINDRAPRALWWR